MFDELSFVPGFLTVYVTKVGWPSVLEVAEFSYYKK